MRIQKPSRTATQLWELWDRVYITYPNGTAEVEVYETEAGKWYTSVYNRSEIMDMGRHFPLTFICNIEEKYERK